MHRSEDDDDDPSSSQSFVRRFLEYTSNGPTLSRYSSEALLSFNVPILPSQPPGGPLAAKHSREGGSRHRPLGRRHLRRRRHGAVVSLVARSSGGSSSPWSAASRYGHIHDSSGRRRRRRATRRRANGPPRLPVSPIRLLPSCRRRCSRCCRCRDVAAQHITPFSFFSLVTPPLAITIFPGTLPRPLFHHTHRGPLCQPLRAFENQQSRATSERLVFVRTKGTSRWPWWHTRVVPRRSGVPAALPPTDAAFSRREPFPHCQPRESWSGVGLAGQSTLAQ